MKPRVICYQDGQVIREATREELERSLEAAVFDGEAGVYQDPVTGVSVYVTGDLSDFEEAGL